MDGYLRLSAQERKTCLDTYRAARAARRALVLVLLAGGRSYRDIGAAALASPSLVRAVKRDYVAGGLDRVLGREARPVPVAPWLIAVVGWLLQGTPRDFGFFRARWSCGLLAPLLWESMACGSAPRRSGAGCAGWSSFGAAPGRWSGRATRSTPRRSGKFAGCWAPCPPTRRRSLRAKWTCT